MCMNVHQTDRNFTESGYMTEICVKVFVFSWLDNGKFVRNHKKNLSNQITMKN